MRTRDGHLGVVGDGQVMGMDQIPQEHKRRGPGTEPCGFLTFRGPKGEKTLER